eukprot:7258026-Prymnesium_polylepis.1
MPGSHPHPGEPLHMIVKRPKFAIVLPRKQNRHDIVSQLSLFRVRVSRAAALRYRIYTARPAPRAAPGAGVALK